MKTRETLRLLAVMAVLSPIGINLLSPQAMAQATPVIEIKNDNPIVLDDTITDGQIIELDTKNSVFNSVFELDKGPQFLLDDNGNPIVQKDDNLESNKVVENELNNKDKVIEVELDDKNKVVEGELDDKNKVVEGELDDKNKVIEKDDVVIDDNTAPDDNTNLVKDPVKDLVAGLEAKVTELKGKVSELQTEVTGLQDTILEKDKSVEDLEDKIATKNTLIEELKKQIADLEEELCLEKEKNANLSDQIATMETELKETKDLLESLKLDFEKLAEENKKLVEDKEIADKAIKEKDEKIKEKDEKIAKLEKNKKELETYVCKQEDKLNDLEEKVESFVQTSNPYMGMFGMLNQIMYTNQLLMSSQWAPSTQAYSSQLSTMMMMQSFAMGMQMNSMSDLFNPRSYGPTYNYNVGGDFYGRDYSFGGYNANPSTSTRNVYQNPLASATQPYAHDFNTNISDDDRGSDVHWNDDETLPVEPVAKELETREPADDSMVNAKA